MIEGEFNLKEIKDNPNNFKDLLFYPGPIIYRLHNIVTDQSYIGSTKVDLNFRLLSKFKGHLEDYLNENRKSKLYESMRTYGIESFTVSILSDNFNDTEEMYITKYDSYNNGLNSTIDGFGWNTTKKSLLTGTIKVYKDNTLIHINPDELEEYINNDWIKGDCFVGKGSRGTTFVTKGDVTKRIPKSELNLYLSQGWVNHRTLWTNKKQYYHKGDEVKIIYPNKIEKYESMGFVKGKPHRNYITNGFQDKIVSDSELQNYLDSGWRIGKSYSSTGGKKRTIIDGKVRYI